jgi:hypothetical protein
MDLPLNKYQRKTKIVFISVIVICAIVLGAFTYMTVEFNENNDFNLNAIKKYKHNYFKIPFDISYCPENQDPMYKFGCLNFTGKAKIVASAIESPTLDAEIIVIYESIEGKTLQNYPKGIP